VVDRIDAVCDRFEAAWKAAAAGTEPRIEDYVGPFPQGERAALLGELVLLDVHYRARRGERPRPEEYGARFPALDCEWLGREMAAPPAPEAAGPTGAGDPGAPAPAPAEGDAAAGAWPEIPGYELLGVLGTGGMGVVYKARQLGFERVVALKMIRAGAHAAAADRARFRIEVQAVARLRHPNIVEVYDVGEHDGCPYYSLEYAEGGSLADQVKAAPPSPRRAAELVETLARAMHHVHEKGVVHRDLKPQNVLLDRAGTPKITDFGLAKLLDAEATQTSPGAVLGTAPYMAPEQGTGGASDVGPPADVYGLGALLYALLTGRPPFLPGPLAVVLEQLRTQEPPPPRSLRPDLPRDLEAVCLQCLRKNPNRRYPSAEALADDLRRWREDKPTVARPLRWPARALRLVRRRPLLGAAALLLLVLAVGLPVASYFLDPERVPKDDLRQLERRWPVPLIGPTGPPRWRRNVIGEASVVDAPGKDGVFSFSSRHAAYVELLPACAAKGYRFRVEVRFEDSGPGGEAGLYLLRSQFPTATGTSHGCCTLRLNDRLHECQDTAGRPGSWLSLEVRRHHTPGRFEGTAPAEVGSCLPPAAPWRELMVEVTPEEVRVFCDGRRVGAVPRARLAAIFQAHLNNRHDPALYDPGLAPSFAPVGGLGVFVRDGWASFRNAAVEPLD
jgi:serine/threonine-protein kinase